MIDQKVCRMPGPPEQGFACTKYLRVTELRWSAGGSLQNLRRGVGVGRARREPRAYAALELYFGSVGQGLIDVHILANEGCGIEGVSNLVAKLVIEIVSRKHRFAGKKSLLDPGLVAAAP